MHPDTTPYPFPDAGDYPIRVDAAPPALELVQAYERLAALYREACCVESFGGVPVGVKIGPAARTEIARGEMLCAAVRRELDET